MRNALRLLRQQRGLAQQELARLAGISRQSLHSIESGRSDPSTSVALALARALECRVEELFSLDEEEADLLVHLAPSHGAGARACVGFVEGRWVAHALPAAEPASLLHTADALLPSRGRAGALARVHALRPREALRDNVLVAGCDPAIGLLAAHLAERRPGERVQWLPATSGAALAAFARGEAHVAGAHLYDEPTGEFNVPFVRALSPARPAVVVNLSRWREGLIVARGNPRRLRRVADLARPGVRLVNRAHGSGARTLLDRLLRKAGVPGAALDGYERTAPGHAAVAQAVALGAADAGIGAESAALAQGLEFVPLAEERFDLVLSLAFAQGPLGGRLLDALAARPFRRELAALGGYGTRESGHVIAEIAA